LAAPFTGLAASARRGPPSNTPGAHQEDYSALLFVIAETPKALRRNLAALVGPLVLNLPEQSETEEPVRLKAALDWLSEHPGWFLILDNLDTPEAMDEA
jgi:hypothetical protein